MGLFTRSKELVGPLPSLALHLTNPQDKVFKPNDSVSGHITLSTPVPINPLAIEVSLWGSSSIWIRTEHTKTTGTSGARSSDYRHWRDNTPLFSVNFNLLQKQQQLQPEQDYTFPFNFRIPEGTGSNKTGCYKKDADARWTVQPHNLPPTFFWGSKPDMPNNALITYGVTAKLICPGVGVGKHGEEPIESVAPILFQPLNPFANAPMSVARYPKNFTLTSSSLTGQEPSSIGFRQKLSDRFSSGTPKLEFEVGLEIPDLLASGSEFSFRSTFNVLNKSDNVTHIPAVTFKVVKLELLDFTFLRAPRDFEANSFHSGHHRDGTPENMPTGPFSGQEQTECKEQKTLLNSLPDSKTMVLEEVMAAREKKGMKQASSCEVWFSARVPGFMPPSFQSFAISRMYRVKVKMGVEIGGKKFEHEVESHVRSLGSAM